MNTKNFKNKKMLKYKLKKRLMMNVRLLKNKSSSFQINQKQFINIIKNPVNSFEWCNKNN